MIKSLIGRKLARLNPRFLLVFLTILVRDLRKNQAMYQNHQP
jgi:hypothetical protein